MQEYFVCRDDELGEKDRRVVECGDRTVGVFRVDGEIHAWHNRCAHLRGPVCQGRIYQRVVEPVAEDGTVRMLEQSAEHTHIVCPWHGYEYDLKTGAHPGNDKVRLKRVEHDVRDGAIYVTV